MWEVRQSRRSDKSAVVYGLRTGVSREAEGSKPSAPANKDLRLRNYTLPKTIPWSSAAFLRSMLERHFYKAQEGAS